jgi:16S rRNA (cytidine1402-2'-O)-methyltransferase
MPSLYIVATPIGNLEDITLRALRVLREASLIAAEDTRTTRKLLSHYDIHTPLTSYHDHNRAQKIPVIVKALEQGDVALVSDAGTPGISDPGLELVQAAIDRGVSVVSIPGPSAVITALAASGMSADHFLFLGFLPRRKGERQGLLRSVSELPYTIVLFEAPHRLQQTLADLQEVLGDRQMAAVREATKLYEEVFRGTVSQCQEHFALPRGEFTLVVGGRPRREAPSPLEAEEMLRTLLAQGVSSREARERVATSTGMSRRVVYQMWLRLRGDAQS